MEFQKHIDAAPSALRCSVAPDVPQIPKEAEEFAKELGALCEKYSLREVEATIRIHTGWKSLYEKRIKDGERITQNMVCTVSRIDGRGRPRTQIKLTATSEVVSQVVWQPDSSD